MGGVIRGLAGNLDMVLAGRLIAGRASHFTVPSCLEGMSVGLLSVADHRVGMAD